MSVTITRGIDISSHQGNINLAELKANNQLDFVIIRAGYGTKGTLDNKFKRNADLCRELGIPVGFYWYSYALNIEDARKEALSFVNAIEPYKDILKYGAWFDMEDADGYKQKHGMPSNQTLQEICAMFCKIVEESGFYTGIYASKYWFNNQLNNPELLNRYDKWVAQWPTSNNKQLALATNPESKTDYSLWQFTSEGRLKGYNGNLDMNYAYKEFVSPAQLTQSNPPDQSASLKPIETIADEVMLGKWGNGEERKQKLTEAGYDYDAVQALVNKHTPAKKIILAKGMKVKFTGTKSYSGIKLSSWVTGDTFDVIEVSGDRVVIGKGSAVTAAVNIKYCEKI